MDSTTIKAIKVTAAILGTILVIDFIVAAIALKAAQKLAANDADNVDLSS